MTIRKRIIELLRSEPAAARELSQRMGITEKEVFEHLDHVMKSAKAGGLQFEIVPAKCLSCGYRFFGRKRVTAPGRCPACKGSHIENPMYCIRG